MKQTEVPASPRDAKHFYWKLFSSTFIISAVTIGGGIRRDPKDVFRRDGIIVISDIVLFVQASLRGKRQGGDEQQRQAGMVVHDVLPVTVYSRQCIAGVSLPQTGENVALPGRASNYAA